MNGHSTPSLESHGGVMAILRWHGSHLTLAALTVVVFVTMSLLNPGRFLSAANLESMAFQFPELALLSFAMLLAMLSGGIDLSVVAVANLCGILAAMILTGEFSGGEPPGGTAMSLVLAVAVAVACGACCGSLNGLLISRLEVSPILATLGTMQIFAGAGLVLTRGRAVHGFPESFLALGNGSLWGVPVPFLFFAAAAALVWLLSSRTALGIHMRLLGTNPTAAPSPRRAGKRSSENDEIPTWQSGRLSRPDHRQGRPGSQRRRAVRARLCAVHPKPSITQLPKRQI